MLIFREKFFKMAKVMMKCFRGVLLSIAEFEQTSIKEEEENVFVNLMEETKGWKIFFF